MPLCAACSPPTSSTTGSFSARVHSCQCCLYLQYLIKPCVRGFSEMPTDNEFNSGDLALIVDDYNPGCACPCLPTCFKRLTLTAKVRTPTEVPHLYAEAATLPLSSQTCGWSSAKCQSACRLQDNLKDTCCSPAIRYNLQENCCVCLSDQPHVLHNQQPAGIKISVEHYPCSTCHIAW